jgi:hypothetical protein
MFPSRSIVITCLACASFTSSSIVRAEETYYQHQNIVYAEVHGIGLLMDVFTPTGDKNGLAIHE